MTTIASGGSKFLYLCMFSHLINNLASPQHSRIRRELILPYKHLLQNFNIILQQVATPQNLYFELIFAMLRISIRAFRLLCLEPEWRRSAVFPSFSSLLLVLASSCIATSILEGNVKNSIWKVENPKKTLYILFFSSLRLLSFNTL